MQENGASNSSGPLDETFFNIKRLHLVFAVAALALLAATVWMFAADHRRPWKNYQRTFRQEIEPWLGQLNGRTAASRASAWQTLLGMPLIDAFGRPVTIEQTWLPDLTIDYHFRQVPRFDRCATCHQAIEKSTPGHAGDPIVSKQTVFDAQLPVPSSIAAADASSPASVQVRQLFGLSLADHGPLGRKVIVAAIEPRSAAAQARLAVGDELLAVGGQSLSAAADTETLLVEQARPGKPIPLRVRRGFTHPYVSHPRLNLFVGAASPHPMAEFGCTICHDSQGSATDFTWASHSPNTVPQGQQWREEHNWSRNVHWEWPMLPARFSESRCLKCHHEVTDLQPSRRFPDPPAPKLLAGYEVVRQYGCFGCHEIQGYDSQGRRVGPDMRLEPAAQPTGSPARTDGPPGKLRRVGPDLSQAGTRLSMEFIADWVRQPTRYRPATRMPQLFGLHEHLDEPTRQRTARLEEVELRAIAEYLTSRPLLPKGASESPKSPAPVGDLPGRRLFELSGCLACHKHRDFPKATATQAPDLSDLGSKYTTSAAHDWLAAWIRDPVSQSPRTKMPNVWLDAKDASQSATEIAAWLLQSKGTTPRKLPEPAPSDVDQLVREHLAASFPADAVDRYLRDGVPADQARSLQIDAEELSGGADLPRKLRYLGRRTIRKRGCFGCHQVPGLEDAVQIGPNLSDWGRKLTSLLAFERVAQTVKPSADSSSSYEYFREALVQQRREGFLWQKLRAPRSFDYQRAHNKPFNQQLLMGRFALTDQQREAAMTFVLGLVAQPPADRYVAKPDPRARAIAEGRQVLDQYACATCHTLEHERWTLEFPSGQFPRPAAPSQSAVAKSAISAAALAASKQMDLRGMGHAEVYGMPRLDPQGRLEETEDDDGNPQYGFTLFEPAAIDGAIWPVGGADLLVGKGQIVDRRPPEGGDLARLLYPVVVADARAGGATTAQREAWGWLPPPLVDEEGRRAQPAWLHSYLQSPYVIRPAAVLRMPRYNLSSEEAERLVAYFAARAGAQYPFTKTINAADRQRLAEPAEFQRLEHAERIVQDGKTFCLKCHLVGSRGPGGQTRTVLAPNLQQVAPRIQPDYLRRWLANPRAILPYTPMPVNFPPDGPPIGQDLYPGTSQEQLDAVAELLLNYDWYLGRKAERSK